MNKTFKKSIACLLAVLMVLFSVPFTAFAASLPADQIKVAREWWVDDGIAIEDVKAEPTYWGYNSPEDPVHQPMGPWYNNFGQAIDISDDTGWEDHRNDYKPVIGVTVSSIGADGMSGSQLKNVYNKYYGAKDIDYTTAKTSGYLLNPAELEAGQRIAVTLEFGGFDVINNGQFKGTYDTEYLQAGYYSATPARNDTWKNIEGSSTFAWASTSNTLGYYGNAFSSAGENTNDGTFYLGFAGKTAMGGGATYSNFLGTGSEPLDGDPNTVRPFGEYGCIGGTITFKVLKNCDLSEVFHFTPYETDSMDDPTYTENGTMFEPFNRDTLDGPSVITVVGEANGINVFAKAPIIWSEYSAEAETPSHEHSYGEPSYVWADDNSTCTATMVCSTCDEATEGHTVTETVDAVENVTSDATCTAEGSATYTATFTNPAFAAQEKTVTLPMIAHDFTGSYAHIDDSDPSQHAKTCTECGAIDVDNAENCEFVSEVTTPATCVAEGETTYTCNVCGYSYTETIPATGVHTPDYSQAVYNWTGDDETGYTACVAVVPCSVCGGTALEVPATVTPVSDGATCTTPGKTTYTATFDDENLEAQTKVVTGGTLPHDYDYENVEYTWDGTTSCKAVATCKNCDATVEATTTNITSEVTVQPTCQTMGTTTYTATFDGEFGIATTEVQDVPTVGHNMVEVPGSAVEATVDNAGKYADKECSYGCGTTEPGAEIPQLAHYTVTATAENGTAEVQGVSPMNNVAVNGNITLVATPATEDLEFVGWSLNGKIVSTSTTYTTKAIADAAYVAIFKEAEQDTFTVVFTDQYGNVYSSQDVASGAEVVMPEDPILVGFTFKGWSMTEDEIKALTDSATINAIFERTQVDSYTVTVPEGCTIDGVEGTTTSVDYNTLVTVKAPADATNGTWKVNGAAVAYGTSYTFFVGDNVTLTFEESDVVEAVPTVASISTSKDTASVKVAFLATRSVASGYTYVNAGFVYGKNLDNSELFLEKVGDKGAAADAGNIKACYCSTDAEQFRLSYGISTGVGKVSAKAFLAYVDNETGTTHVIYGEPQEYTY